MKHLPADALAGVVTILTVHQPLILALHAAGLVSWRAYDLRPVAPFGLPALASASLWGAAWTLGIARLGRSAGGRPRHLRAAVAGGALTTAVGALLIVAGRGVPLAGMSPAAAALGSLFANGLWAGAASWTSARIRLAAAHPGRPRAAA